MDQHEQRLIRFLSTPEGYSHPVGKIDRRETHVSHVFLAGAFAYKLKKPVKFPFLDASTLAQRKKFCLLELSLNRRLAPSIYLEIVPVVELAGRLQLGGRGRVIEWVVKMRRLPEKRMLDYLLARSKVRAKDIEQVAHRLIPFFRRAARSRSIDRFGLPSQVRELVLGNLSECRPFVGTLLPETDRQQLEAAYKQYLALHEPLLAARVRKRCIIDGHGDLRCENICLSEPVSIFDCVEFQPAFRCGDIANDFSFLVMDLEFRSRRDLARVLVNHYRRTMRDSTFDQVLPFYQCHRSLVRGKVRGFAWLQRPKTAQGRRIRTLSRRHFGLAVKYARQFAPPRLLVVGGLIGTGKSTTAKWLADALGAVWLRTDEIRLNEFSQERRPNQEFSEGLYAPQVSEKVYRRLIQRAETLVRRGHSVVCDGTFSKAAGRNELRRVAQRCRASFHFFECVVPRAIALRRLAQRLASKADISEARPEHYDRLRAGFEPVRAWPAAAWTRLRADRSPAAVLEAALHSLRRAWRIPSS